MNIASANYFPIALSFSLLAMYWQVYVHFRYKSESAFLLTECDPEFVLGWWSILGWSASKVGYWLCCSLQHWQDGNVVWFSSGVMCLYLKKYLICILFRAVLILDGNVNVLWKISCFCFSHIATQECALEILDKYVRIILLFLVVTGLNLRLRTCILTLFNLPAFYNVLAAGCHWASCQHWNGCTQLCSESFWEGKKVALLENLCVDILIYTVFFYLGFSSIRLYVQLHVKRRHRKCWLWLHS